MTLGPGGRIGGYEVGALIGEGGMGQVYRATDTKLERAVAIKVLPESLAADPERIARFQREAKTLAALNHPNIAQVHGFEESGGLAALVIARRRADARGSDRPEQAKGEPVDHRCDIFAFGCVLAEMLTARRVLDGALRRPRGSALGSLRSAVSNYWCEISDFRKPERRRSSCDVVARRATAVLQPWTRATLEGWTEELKRRVPIR